jgi:hypothetical protein
MTRKRLPDLHPPTSIDEGIALVRAAMTRAGLVGQQLSPAKMRIAVAESNLASEIEKIELSLGLTRRPHIPYEWGWPKSYMDALFFGDEKAVGVPMYNRTTKRWHICAVLDGNLFVDKEGTVVCFESPEIAKGNIDKFNEKRAAKKKVS